MNKFHINSVEQKPHIKNIHWYICKKFQKQINLIVVVGSQDNGYLWGGSVTPSQWEGHKGILWSCQNSIWHLWIKVVIIHICLLWKNSLSYILVVSAHTHHTLIKTFTKSGRIMGMFQCDFSVKIDPSSVCLFMYGTSSWWIGAFNPRIQSSGFF